MNEIKRGRLNDFLVRFLGLDVGPPAPFVGGEIVPVLEVEQPGDERRWNAGWRRFGVGIAVTAGAGAPRVRLNNIAGSGVMVVVDQIAFSPAANDVCLAGLVAGVANLPTAPTTQHGAHDTRSGVGVAPDPARGAASVSVENAIAVTTGSQVFRGSVLANTTLFVRREVIVVPGWALDCWQLTAASSGNFTIHWRERAVDALELNA